MVPVAFAVSYHAQSSLTATEAIVKALTLNGYDDLSSLSFADVAVPEPGSQDVLGAADDSKSASRGCDGEIRAGEVRYGRRDQGVRQVMTGHNRGKFVLDLRK